MSDYANNPPGDEPLQRDTEIVWRGVNNRLPAEKLPEGFVPAGLNVRMRQGDIEPRLGCVRPGWLNAVSGKQVLPAGGVLHGAGIFSDPNTREWTLTAADGLIWAGAPNNVRQSVPLPPGVKVLGPCRLVQAFNQMFCFRGRYLAPLVLRTWSNGFEDILPHYDPVAGGSNQDGIYHAAVQTIEQLADEMAWGPFLAVSSLTSTGALATCVTSAPHGYVTGADVTLQGATPAEYNGRFNVTVLDPTTFTFQFAGSGTSPAAGTILCSNMSQYWAALGDRLTLPAGALTSSGTVATVDYTAHGLNVGDWCTISGAVPPGYNGLVQVQTKPDANHFTYTVASGLATPATGTIYVQKTTVTANHTPVSHPEAWQPLYNILPNADDALYINGRLLVPTAYTPGDNGYDSTASWSKQDYLVAMDTFDQVHFQFVNGFRINQGDDSEITNVVKYDNNTVIVTKGRRWGILSNLQGDLSGITFDLRGGNYGCASVRSAVAAGKDVYFPSPLRGLVSLNQTSQGLVQGMDKPFSADIPAWVARINWNAGEQQRMAWWNDCLYWAVAIDSSPLNNAVLVYDFHNQAWVGLDQGAVMSVKEFFHVNVGGLDRLCFLGNDGWVNLMEESEAGDQIADGGQPGGLGWAEIPTDVTLKGHLFGQAGQKTFPLLELGLAVWNACLTVTVTSGGMRTTRTALASKTFSRTAYLKPFNKAPWEPTNVNGDWAEPNRGDYSVPLVEGINLTGIAALQYQEIFLRPSTKTFRANYALIRVQNATGRLKIKALTPAAQPGERRMGVMI